MLEKGFGWPARGYRNVRWQQIAAELAATLCRHGRLCFGFGGGPVRHTYLGLLEVAVRAHTDYGTNPAVVHYRLGEKLGWTAVLAAGIVSRAGQR